MLKLSVIIVSYNTKELLKNCLNSLKQATKNISHEIIVVDNGSIDDTISMINSFFPEIILIANKENKGFASACNQGLLMMNGEYALFLNSDLLLFEDTIDKLINFMDNNAEAAIAGAQLLNPDGSKQNSIDLFPSLLTELFNKSLLKFLMKKKYPSKRSGIDHPIVVESLVGACMMVRKNVLDNIGFFDEDYFFYMEETDLCYRIKKANLKVYFVPDAFVVHFQGKSVKKTPKKGKVEYYRSRYIFFRKNRGFYPYILLKLGLIIKLSFEILLQGAGVFLTLGLNSKVRRRFFITIYLFLWHIFLCPEGWGLNGK
ncbi:MAG: glycosyltransferase family 2 protein [Deltaproteobacteria bacterium]|nr:glycosyltransferase family 2 protein [Deltaproteobacteria bacterium]